MERRMKPIDQLFEKINYVNLAEWNVLHEATGTTVVYMGVAIERCPRRHGARYDIKIFEHQRPTAVVHHVAEVDQTSQWAKKFERICAFHKQIQDQRREDKMQKYLQWKIKELP